LPRGAAMSGSPDSEFAKIFELLNAFEQLDEDEQPLQSTVPAQASVPAQQPLKPNLPAQLSIALEADENSFAAHVAAAMAKRRNC
jgi:hypothetical protein